MVVEFKVVAADIIPEFGRGLKAPNELDLLIAWDLGVSPLERYGFGDIEYSRTYQLNPRATFPSAKRYIGDTESGSMSKCW